MSSLRELAVLWELLLISSVDVEHLAKGMVIAQQVKLFLPNSSYIAREVSKMQYQGVKTTCGFLLSTILGQSKGNGQSFIHFRSTK